MQQTKVTSNSGRQFEIDLIKALAIVFMVIVHTTEYYYNGESKVFEGFIEFIGSPPGAPIFMMALGIGIVYSRNNAPLKLLHRGINLFVFSYAFNALVYALPYYLAGDSETAVTEIMDIDILQFAGLTFMFMALIKKLDLKVYSTAIIIVILQAVNYCCQYFEIISENYILARIQGLFWWTCEDCYFPFFSWIIYPVAGYYFAQLLKTCTNKDTLYRLLGIGGLTLYVLLYIAGYFLGVDYGAYGQMYQESYYAMGLYGNLTILAFAFFWIAACYYIGKLFPDWLKKIVENCSRNVTYIYFIQYILIIWIQVLIFGDELEVNTISIVFISTLYLIICYVISTPLRKYKKKRHEIFEAIHNRHKK